MTDTKIQHAPCVDHLVVLAADLASGVDWCERTLGITPTAGGEHPLMGTHNRIFNVASPTHPRAYLEIIAINPGASKAISTGARRWFDMDDANLQAEVAQHGPQLIHWVASVPEVAAQCAALAALDIEHTWAIDLVNVLHDAGVETALNFRVPAQVVDEAFASLPVNN